MLVLGINKGVTLNSKPLRYGGVAVSKNGEIQFAISEERVTKQKWAGGFNSALEHALKETQEVLKIPNLHPETFDAIAVSTCCEDQEAALKGHSLTGLSNIVSVNHHISHASLAYYPSQFREAIVVVIDGGGNTFSNDISPSEWWAHAREQHSYYVGHDSTLELVDRDCFEPKAVGFGEIFRAFTYFLGWHSSRWAAKTMALSAYGKSNNIGTDYLVSFEDGKLKIPVENDPRDPIGLIRRLGAALGVDFGEPRQPNAEILPLHCDIAAYVQKSVEWGLKQKIKWLVEKHRVHKLCLSGGFALNCVANGQILKDGFVEEIYLPSSPGDEGQALGNAVWQSVAGTKTKGNRHYMPHSTDVQFGARHFVSSGTVSKLLKKHKAADAIVIEARRLPSNIAELLRAGFAVCVYRGRSEAGLRALGARSILGNPHNDSTRVSFNQMKGREWFQPFAPSILEDQTKAYFGKDAKSPFMSFALPVSENRRVEIPAVMNYDGTARLQTVSSADDSLLRSVLTEFHSLTGTPLVLNTSFNVGGEPIVETPDDAVRVFSSLGVNSLAIERLLVIKSFVPQLVELNLVPSELKVAIKIIEGTNEKSLPIGSSMRQTLRWLHSMTDQVVFIRSDFPLYGEYLEWLGTGRKVTTIRFRKGAVEFPGSYVSPLFATSDFELNLASKKPTEVQVQSIKYLRFGELTEEDAFRDGFRSYDEMRAALGSIYPKLTDDDWVTIYSISLVESSVANRTTTA